MNGDADRPRRAFLGLGSNLGDRRALLKALLDDKGTDRVRFSEAFEADPTSIVAAARTHSQARAVDRTDCGMQAPPARTGAARV